MVTRLLLFITTCGGIGYTPYVPGTMMSLVTVVILWFFPLTPVFMIGTAGILCCIGVVCSHYVENLMSLQDPSFIVIDELVGMMLSLCCVPHTIAAYATTFLLFRLFDATKWGGGKYFEQLPGGWGVMLDDVYAALQTLCIVRLVMICCV